MKRLNKKSNFIILTSLIVLITFTAISMNVSAQFTLSFTSPTSETQWYQGDTVYINWTTTVDPGETITLRLYRDNAGVVMTIEQTMLNNKSYPWSIPEDLESKKDYKIQLMWVEDLPQPVEDVIHYWYSDAFTIGTVAAIPGYPTLLLIGCSLIFTIGFAVYLLKKRSISAKV
ncbi:MAG: GPI anchored serine-threonine rich family protein [Promethearchaeota archaeon]